MRRVGQMKRVISCTEPGKGAAARTLEHGRSFHAQRSAPVTRPEPPSSGDPSNQGPEKWAFDTRGILYGKHVTLSWGLSHVRTLWWCLMMIGYDITKGFCLKYCCLWFFGWKKKEFKKAKKIIRDTIKGHRWLNRVLFKPISNLRKSWCKFDFPPLLSQKKMITGHLFLFDQVNHI